MKSSMRTAIRTAIRNLLPAGRRLGYEFLAARLTGRLEPELLHLDRITRGGRLALDIGANQGFFSYALARSFERVIAFEPNPTIAADLRAYRSPRIRIESVALSAADGRGELFLPEMQGVEQHGWASFDRNNLPDATSVKALDVSIRSLDSYGLTDLDFVKIDVEGHEPEVLAGATGTLRRNRPVILAEVKAANRERVLALLSELGYAPRRFRDGAVVAWSPEVDDDGENFVFVPTADR